MLTFAEVAPTGTTTRFAIGAWAALLLRETSIPPVGALPVNVIVATAVFPETTVVGMTAIEVRAAGRTVTVPVFCVPSAEAVIVTVLDAVTGTEVAVNVAEVLPAATVTEAGALSAEALPDDNETT